jgi:hypothetical protein
LRQQAANLNEKKAVAGATVPYRGRSIEFLAKPHKTLNSFTFEWIKIQNWEK